VLIKHEAQFDLIVGLSLLDWGHISHLRVTNMCI